MKSRTLWSVSLGLAAFFDCSLALYHFVLPYHMDWQSGLGNMPDSLVWALYGLNFSWSLLLLLVGALVFIVSRLGPTAGSFARWTIFAVGLFWLIHGAYTWLHPLPMPASLNWLKYALTAFPAVTAALHWLPLLVYRGAADRTRA